MPSSHDPVIKMFHCLSIVLKIPLFFMPSSHDPVIKMFRCLFIVLKISLFSIPSSHDPVINMFHCLNPTVFHAICTKTNPYLSSTFIIASGKSRATNSCVKDDK
jgi:hypothetical protein